MTRSLSQAALALLTIGALLSTSIPAQAQNTQPAQSSPAPAAQPQGQGQPPVVQYQPPQVQQQQAAPASAIPTRDLRISTGPNYALSNSWFPDVIAPYTPMRVELPMLTNTPKVGQLIQDGKLVLSLEDAISLAVQNNLDIAVQRYTPWLDEASLLLAKSGANGRLAFDPTLTGQVLLEQLTNPINNPFLAGVGASTTSSTTTASNAPGIVDHNFVANFNYTEGFHYGTQLQVGFTNTRSSVNLGQNLFNPYVESALTTQITQPLLNGFGRTVNDRYIIEAQRTVKVGEWQFAQAVIQDITTTENDYWELVYSIENIKVEQTTVDADQVLDDNNKKQLEIGTMAPLDVITAESQLASDQQALVQAQTVKLQDETKLLNDITKDPLAGPLGGIQIVPTTTIFTPEVVENLPIQDAVSEAWQKRPEILQADLNLQNTGTEVKATRNLLLPALNLYGEYQATGIGGDQHTTVPTGDFATGSSLVFPAAGTGLLPATAVGFVGSGTTAPGPVFLNGSGRRLRHVDQGALPDHRGWHNVYAADSQPGSRSPERHGTAQSAAAVDSVPATPKHDFRGRAQCANRSHTGPRGRRRRRGSAQVCAGELRR